MTRPERPEHYARKPEEVRERLLSDDIAAEELTRMQLQIDLLEKALSNELDFYRVTGICLTAFWRRLRRVDDGRPSGYGPSSRTDRAIVRKSSVELLFVIVRYSPCTRASAVSAKPYFSSWPSLGIGR